MNVNLGGINGTVIGACGATSTPVLTFSAVGGIAGQAKIKLRRTVGTSMYYKIDGYLSSHPSAIAVALQAETSMTTDVDFAVTVPYAVVVVSVRNNVGSNIYQIDYMVY
jgi:hypothetical protein